MYMKAFNSVIAASALFIIACVIVYAGGLNQKSVLTALAFSTASFLGFIMAHHLQVQHNKLSVMHGDYVFAKKRATCGYA
ncbi:MAG: hypothetical protein WKG03_16445 [Telluria sp.]